MFSFHFCRQTNVDNDLKKLLDTTVVEKTHILGWISSWFNTSVVLTSFTAAYKLRITTCAMTPMLLN